MRPAITLTSKLDKDITENKNNKPKSLIEHRRQNPQQNVSKLNPTIIKRIISHHHVCESG